MSTRPPERGDPSQLAPATPLLTTEEAAAFLNVPPRWLAEAARLRRVRCTRLGKHVRFRREHLEELIAAGEQPVSACAASPATSLSLAAGTPHRGRSRL